MPVIRFTLTNEKKIDIFFGNIIAIEEGNNDTSVLYLSSGEKVSVMGTQGHIEEEIENILKKLTTGSSLIRNAPNGSVIL